MRLKEEGLTEKPHHSETCREPLNRNKTVQAISTVYRSINAYDFIMLVYPIHKRDQKYWNIAERGDVPQWDNEDIHNIELWGPDMLDLLRQRKSKVVVKEYYHSKSFVTHEHREGNYRTWWRQKIILVDIGR